MTDIDDRDMDNPYRRFKPETYEQALARCIVLQRDPELTEQQRAEREVEARERMRRHDLHFADDFISGPEQQMVSKTLAKRLGFNVGDERVTGDIDRDERMQFGDND